jgi:hypothetical protein
MIKLLILLIPLSVLCADVYVCNDFNIKEIDDSGMTTMTISSPAASSVYENVYLLSPFSMIASNMVVDSDYCYFDSKFLTIYFPNFAVIQQGNVCTIEAEHVFIDHKKKYMIGRNATIICSARGWFN